MQYRQVDSQPELVTPMNCTVCPSTEVVLLHCAWVLGLNRQKSAMMLNVVQQSRQHRWTSQGRQHWKMILSMIIIVFWWLKKGCEVLFPCGG
jgi:hypothetical protein